MDPRNYHRRRELEALRKAHNDVLTTQLEGLHRVRSESAHNKTATTAKKKKKIRRSDLLLSMADSQQYHKRVVGKAELAARLAQRRLAQRALRSAASDNEEIDYGVDDEEEYAALLAEGVNEELLLDDGVVANIKRRRQNGLALEIEDDGSEDDSDFGGSGAASGNEGDKLLDDEYYYKRSLNLGSISTGREVWGGGGGKREPNGTAEQRLRRRQAPVLATHLVDVHTHVRQFYEVLSAWLAPTHTGGTPTKAPNSTTSDPVFLTQDLGDEAATTSSATTDRNSPLRNSPTQSDNGPLNPPFPFALTWLRTVLPPDAEETADGQTHPSALGRLSEAEAVKVLKKQVARSQKFNESSMYDPSDYGPLQESILAYLSLTYFAVAKAVSNNSSGHHQHPVTPYRVQSPVHPSTTSKTESGAGAHRGSITGSNHGSGRSSPHFSTSINNNTTTTITATSARVRVSPQRDKRPSSSGSFSEKQRSGRASAPTVPPPPKLISMNIARALCRPGSASVAVHSQTPGTRVGSAHQPSYLLASVALPPTSPQVGAGGGATKLPSSSSRPATAGMPVTYASPRDRSFGKATSGANRDKYPLGDSVLSVQEQAERSGARLGVDINNVGDHDGDGGVVEWNPQQAASATRSSRPGTAPAPVGNRRPMTSTVQPMDLPHSSSRPTSAAHPPLSYRPRPPTGTVEFAKPTTSPAPTAAIVSSSSERGSGGVMIVADPSSLDVVSAHGERDGALVSRDHNGVSTELSQRPFTAVRPDGLMLSSGPGSESSMPPQPTSPATVKPVSTSSTVGPMMGSPGSYKATWGPHSDAKWVGRRK